MVARTKVLTDLDKLKLVLTAIARAYQSLGPGQTRETGCLMAHEEGDGCSVGFREFSELQGWGTPREILDVIAGQDGMVWLVLLNSGLIAIGTVGPIGVTVTWRGQA